MIKLTPPMGWNSWNTFGENINEKMIFETADVMAESGLRDKGYEYLVIDDCWSLRERDENGRLVPDPEKFPHGMKAVADYVHSKGLKFGMYSCAGNMTCAGYPGSYEHEFVDAETFASWDVDFLKYDYCYHSPILHGKYLYRRTDLHHVLRRIWYKMEGGKARRSESGVYVNRRSCYDCISGGIVLSFCH